MRNANGTTDDYKGDFDLVDKSRLIRFAILRDASKNSLRKWCEERGFTEDELMEYLDKACDVYKKERRICQIAKMRRPVVEGRPV